MYKEKRGWIKAIYLDLYEKESTGMHNELDVKLRNNAGGF